MQITSIMALVLPLILSNACLNQSDVSNAQPTLEFVLKSPAPRPDFVAYIFPKPYEEIEADTRVVVGLWEEALWETGNDHFDLHLHIRRNTWMRVDGRRISFEINELYESLPDGFVSIQFGFVPDDIIPGIASGPHLVEIHTTSMSGKDYEYYWVMEISDKSK